MIDGRIFFDGWEGVARTVVLALVGLSALRDVPGIEPGGWGDGRPRRDRPGSAASAVH